QINVRATVSETKLHDFHAGDIELLAKRADLRGDVAKIFGDEGQLAELVAEGLEEVFVGTGDPVTVDGGGLIGRDLPAGFETAEVIEAHDVAGFDSPLHALDPPVVSPRL